MCRNIKVLFNFDPPATNDEVTAAALQYVRKISGFTKPAEKNEQAFLTAVEEITASSLQLLAALRTTAPKKDREVERQKAKVRAEKRGIYG